MALIGLIGDYNSTIPAHQGIPRSLDMAAAELGVPVRYEWVPTAEIHAVDRIARYSGLWAVPGSPYKNMDGALLAIRRARENGTAFLGTCGGFQHAIVEYARNVLGWADADHAESNPNAARPVVTLLACALVEATETVRFFPGSRIATLYGRSESSEGYRCSYGLNEEFRHALLKGPLRASADDATGEIRAVELADHPFFIATLFQPERAALAGKLSPLVKAFAQKCAGR